MPSASLPDLEPAEEGPRAGAGHPPRLAQVASGEKRFYDMEETTAERRGAISVPAVRVAGAFARLQEGLWRGLEIALTVLLLVVLAPLLALIALAIRLDSRGPVIYRQRRVGRDQRPFTVNKFRTMHHGVGHDSHRAFVLGLIAGEQPEQRTD